jgi:hypothetical protein
MGEDNHPLELRKGLAICASLILSHTLCLEASLYQLLTLRNFEIAISKLAYVFNV